MAHSAQGLSTAARGALLGGFTALVLAATALLPRIAQPASYHDFADQRTLLGIPHALNVLSNVPFLVVGLMGLWWLARHWKDEQPFRDARERWPAVTIFAGLIATAFGSGYYHWHPTNHTLVFDRLGMVVGFMALLPLVVAERVSVRWGLRLLVPAVVLGAASVLHWDWTEMRGAGDLRWYGMIQAYAFVATLGVLLLTRAPYDRQAGWYLGIGCYGLAKVFEVYDGAVYAVTGHAVSGHSLKHVAAAVGGWFLLRMMQTRKLTPEAAGGRATSSSQQAVAR
jgi:hypothetical protein